MPQDRRRWWYAVLVSTHLVIHTDDIQSPGQCVEQAGQPQFRSARLTDIHSLVCPQVANKTGHQDAVKAIQDGVVERARHMYETNMPEDKQDGFDELLEKHEGREEELLQLLEEVLLKTKKTLGVE